MNKTINKIKLFFKSKPARIIIGLLLIAIIMTGVAFGIIAFVNALTNPCPSGQKWNKDIKKCILEKCPNGGNMCLAKGSKAGNCISKDYCGKYGDIQYKFHQKSCECTIDCPDGETPYTRSGKSYTKFTDEKPDEELTCGYKCDYNKNPAPLSDGGYKWCPPDDWCGQLIYEPNNNGAPGLGCFDKDYYHQCPNSDIVCRIGTKCITNAQGESRCEPMLCSGEEKGEKLVQVCLNDHDCKNDGSVDEEYKCITGELASTSEDEKFKFYKGVGYCSKTDKLKTPFCLPKRLIGEVHTSPGSDEPAIKLCRNDSSIVEGISTFNPRCGNIGENGCAKYGICPNKWQGKSSTKKANDKCISSNVPIDQAKKDMEYYCCDHPAITPDGNMFCCPTSTDNDLCTLNTKFGYSKKLLDPHASLSETISCSVNEDCTSYNEAFYKNLGITESEGKDKTNSKYSSLYCDKDDKVCKAYCGYFDSVKQLGHDFIGKIDITKPLSSSKPEQYSYCFPRTNSCELTLPEYNTDGLVLTNGWPVCKRKIGDSTEFAWSGSHGEGYEVGGTTDLLNCSDTDTSITTCINALGKNNYHIHDVSLNGSKCEFTAACDQLKIPTDSGAVSWTDLNRYDIVNKNIKDFSSLEEKIPQLAFNKDNICSVSVVEGKNTCVGKSDPYSYDVTVSPCKYIPETKQCSPKPTYIGNNKLSHSGEYCKLGVNPIDPNGNCCENSECGA